MYSLSVEHCTEFVGSSVWQCEALSPSPILLSQYLCPFKNPACKCEILPILCARFIHPSSTGLTYSHGLMAMLGPNVDYKAVAAKKEYFAGKLLGHFGLSPDACQLLFFEVEQHVFVCVRGTLMTINGVSRDTTRPVLFEKNFTTNITQIVVFECTPSSCPPPDSG